MPTKQLGENKSTPGKVHFRSINSTKVKQSYNNKILQSIPYTLTAPTLELR